MKKKYIVSKDIVGILIIAAWFATFALYKIMVFMGWGNISNGVSLVISTISNMLIALGVLLACENDFSTHKYSVIHVIIYEVLLFIPGNGPAREFLLSYYVVVLWVVMSAVICFWTTSKEIFCKRSKFMIKKYSVCRVVYSVFFIVSAIAVIFVPEWSEEILSCYFLMTMVLGMSLLFDAIKSLNREKE